MRAPTLLVILALTGCTTMNHWSTVRGTPGGSCMSQCMGEETASVSYCARTCPGVTSGTGRCAPFDESSELMCHEHHEMAVGPTMLIVFASLIAVGALGYLAIKTADPIDLDP